MSALDEALARALATCAAAGDGDYDGLLLHAGSAARYVDDDQDRPFRSLPHFARFAPLEGPEHLLLLRPGRPPRLCRVIPRDYWEEPAADPPAFAAESFEWSEAADAEAAAAELAGAGSLARTAYIGGEGSGAAGPADRLGIAPAARRPAALVAALDWERAAKTSFEVARIREAVARAARGHAAVRAGAGEGRSERALHGAYLAAAEMVESDCPYTNIIAWNEHGSVLHYGRKEVAAPAERRCLLIDAGAAAGGYASDITRSYAGAASHPVFVALLAGMDRLQRELVARVAPGARYVALQEEALRGIGELLRDTGVLRASSEEAFERGWIDAFMPHGLGHHLGIQVHDVGGHQLAPDGASEAPPERWPYLRTTRPLAPGQVITVEPGLYFVPMLLEPLRSEASAAFDWPLVDAMLPHGGIRVEDDVLVTEAGCEDLSRPLVPAADTAP